MVGPDGIRSGGLYTYDWIENLFGLHMHSADVILPQFQDLQVGYAQRLGKNGPVLRVAVADQNACLVLRSDDGNWVWAFCLMSDGNQTRLVSRNRISTPGASKLSRMFFKYVMEPGSLIMERKMLLGIKQRAERLERSAPDIWNSDTLRSSVTLPPPSMTLVIRLSGTSHTTATPT